MRGRRKRPLSDRFKSLVEALCRQALADGLPVDLIFATVKRELIGRALEQTGDNKLKAARILNVNRGTLYYYLRHW